MPKPKLPTKNNAPAQATARQTDSGSVKVLGVGNHPAPPPGSTATPKSNLPGGSTLPEKNVPEKTGEPPLPGAGTGTSRLQPVRSDATGQMLTTNQGMRISDNQNALKMDVRGPVLLEDFVLREKTIHFDHKRIPQRTVHARSSGAPGCFERCGPLGHPTKAASFKEVGKITSAVVRFSTVAGERGSKDTARGMHGFAAKFCTDEGNWDLVGNNMPLFSIQDAMKFPDLVHAVKPESHHAMPQAASAHDTFRDFVGLMPESTHMPMWVVSDRAIPRSLVTIQSVGVHTNKLVNEAGEVSFATFHWEPKFGTHSLVWNKAVKICGADPDHHWRDLCKCIETGAHPDWKLGFQMLAEEGCEAFSLDTLDATKIVPRELVPVQKTGCMVLNRNSDNLFAETEQVAFCVSHVVPGIDFSNDPLLAGRIPSHIGTQISRLGGPNLHEIPINASLAPVHNNQRAGMHRQAILRGRVPYESNLLGGGGPFQAGAAQGFVIVPATRQAKEERAKVRAKPEKFADHRTQAKLFFDSQTPVEQAHIAAAFRFELSKSPTLPPKARPGDCSIKARKVAILVAPGIVGQAAFNVHAALFAEGASPRFVGPHTGAIETTDGVALQADASFENEPGFLFDALVLPDGADGVGELAARGQAMDFVTDQYRHAKPILVMGASSVLLDQAGIPVDLPCGQPDPGIMVDDGSGAATKAFIQAMAVHRHPERKTDPPVV